MNNYYSLQNSTNLTSGPSIDKACEYSDSPELLRKLITEDRFKLRATRVGVVPSTWHEGHKALQYQVKVGDYSFPFWGSHNDALALEGVEGPFRPLRKRVLQVKEVNQSVLYSLLCCIRSDYFLGQEEPENLGMDSDSIKDMAKWNEWKEHSKKLRNILRLTDEELEALPQ